MTVHQKQSLKVFIILRRYFYPSLSQELLVVYVSDSLPFLFCSTFINIVCSGVVVERKQNSHWMFKDWRSFKVLLLDDVFAINVCSGEWTFDVPCVLNVSRPAVKSRT